MQRTPNCRAVVRGDTATQRVTDLEASSPKPAHHSPDVCGAAAKDLRYVQATLEGNVASHAILSKTQLNNVISL
jgi:hypothetical protein